MERAFVKRGRDREGSDEADQLNIEADLSFMGAKGGSQGSRDAGEIRVDRF